MSSQYSHLALDGPAICTLMRREGKTIHQIRAEYGITLKRIREVRSMGVSGLAAAEWTKIITGIWPEATA